MEIDFSEGLGVKYISFNSDKTRRSVSILIHYADNDPMELSWNGTDSYIARKMYSSPEAPVGLEEGREVAMLMNAAVEYMAKIQSGEIDISTIEFKPQFEQIERRRSRQAPSSNLG